MTYDLIHKRLTTAENRAKRLKNNPAPTFPKYDISLSTGVSLKALISVFDSGDVTYYPSDQIRCSLCNDVGGFPHTSSPITFVTIAPPYPDPSPQLYDFGALLILGSSPSDYSGRWFVLYRTGLNLSPSPGDPVNYYVVHKPLTISGTTAPETFGYSAAITTEHYIGSWTGITTDMVFTDAPGWTGSGDSGVLYNFGTIDGTVGQVAYAIKIP